MYRAEFAASQVRFTLNFAGDQAEGIGLWGFCGSPLRLLAGD
jgi:hypothetical protein